MKILFVTDFFDTSNLGGASQVVLDAASIMQEEGHSVLIVTTTHSRNQAGVDASGPLSVHRIFTPRLPKFFRSYVSVYNPFVARAFKKVLKRERPDVVHVHNVHGGMSFSAIAWAKKAGARVFFTAHDVLSFAYTRLYHFAHATTYRCGQKNNYRVSWRFLLRENGKAYNPARNVLIRRILHRYADHIFAVSNALRDAMQQNGIQHVTTLYNGINVQAYRASGEDVLIRKRAMNLEGKHILLFGGRGMQDKGPEVLLDVLSIVRRTHPTVVLVYAMELDSYQHQLAGLAKVKNLSDSVLFPGAQRGSDWATLLGAASIVLVPSIVFDSAPLVSLQAMAAGRPVIGTCLGGTSELVQDGEGGFIVNPFQVEEIADRVNRLLNDRELARRMGDSGLARVEREFSLSAFKARLNSYYVR